MEYNTLFRLDNGHKGEFKFMNSFSKLKSAVAQLKSKQVATPVKTSISTPVNQTATTATTPVNNNNSDAEIAVLKAQLATANKTQTDYLKRIDEINNTNSQLVASVSK